MAASLKKQNLDVGAELVLRLPQNWFGLSFVIISKPKNAERGSVLAQVLILLPIAMALTLSAFQMASSARKTSGMLANQVILRGLLDSLLDYTAYGVRDRWCFDSNWNRLLVGCDVSNGRSVDRLLLTPESVLNLETINGSALGTIPEEITATVDISSIASGHPLFPVFASARQFFGDIDRAEFAIKKLTNSKFPSRGGETLLEISVKLVSSTQFIFGNELKATSRLIAMPRQLNYFSLIVARDLHLGASQVDPPDLGDGFIRRAVDPATARGVVFDSPVFVNRDIVLPPTGEKNPVMFFNRPVLGFGVVRDGANPFQPATPGGVGEQTYGDLDRGIAFAKGVARDGQEDRGLTYLAGILTPAPAPAVQAECLKLRSVERELLNLKQSELLIRPTPPVNTILPNTREFTAELALTNYNRFQPQNFSSYQDMGFHSSTPDVKIGIPAVARLRVDVGLDTPGGMMFPQPDGKYLTQCRINQMLGWAAPRTPIDVPIAARAGPVGRWEYFRDASYHSHAWVNNRLSRCYQLNIGDGAEFELTLLRFPGGPGSDLNTSSACPPTSIHQSLTVLPFGFTAISVPVMMGGSPCPTPIYQRETKLTVRLDAISAASMTGTPVDQPNRKMLTLRVAGRDPQLLNFVRVLIEPYDLAYFGGRDRRLQPPLDAQGNVLANDVTPFNLRRPSDLGQPLNPVESTVDPEYSRKGQILLYRPDIISSAGSNLQLHGAGDLVETSPINHNGYHRSSFAALPNPRPPIMGPAGDTLPDHTTVAGTNMNYGELMNICGANRDVSRSFADVNWDNDDYFANQAQESWNFANPAPAATVTIGWANATANKIFEVRARIGTCVVPSTVDLVAGFYVCDRLVIQSRANPLDFIGTLMVSRMEIDPAAVNAGITFRSIYHPVATKILQDQNILRGFSDGAGSCGTFAGATPVWHPDPSIEDQYNQFACNAVSLQKKADPFAWSSVSPDCGLRSGGGSTPSCMRKPRRYLVQEVGRERSI